MTAVQQVGGGRLGMWRLPLWGALATAFVLPFAAMQFTDELRWDKADFAAAAILLVALGAAVELSFLFFRRPRTRALLAGLSLSAFVLIWADAAVGIF